MNMYNFLITIDPLRTIIIQILTILDRGIIQILDERIKVINKVLKIHLASHQNNFLWIQSQHGKVHAMEKQEKENLERFDRFLYLKRLPLGLLTIQPEPLQRHTHCIYPWVVCQLSTRSLRNQARPLSPTHVVSWLLSRRTDLESPKYKMTVQKFSSNNMLLDFMY